MVTLNKKYLRVKALDEFLKMTIDDRLRWHKILRKNALGLIRERAGLPVPKEYEGGNHVR